MTEVVTIRQALDGTVKINYHAAFGAINVSFYDIEGRAVNIVFDVESGVKILSGFDAAKEEGPLKQFLRRFLRKR